MDDIKMWFMKPDKAVESSGECVTDYFLSIFGFEVFCDL